MEINLDSDLESTLVELARQRGIAPEALAANLLRERLLASREPIVPRDEWEELLLRAGSECGVSLPHEALSSEGLYE